METLVILVSVVTAVTLEALVTLVAVVTLVALVILVSVITLEALTQTGTELSHSCSGFHCKL